MKFKTKFKSRCLEEMRLNQPQRELLTEACGKQARTQWHERRVKAQGVKNIQPEPNSKRRRRGCIWWGVCHIHSNVDYKGFSRKVLFHCFLCEISNETKPKSTWAFIEAPSNKTNGNSVKSNTGKSDEWRSQELCDEIFVSRLVPTCRDEACGPLLLRRQELFRCEWRRCLKHWWKSWSGKNAGHDQRGFAATRLLHWLDMHAVRKWSC